MVLVVLVGCGVLLASFVLYAMATAVIVDVAARLIRRGYADENFWSGVALMMIVTLITAASHLVQIALWALVLLGLGETAGFEDAFYFSAESYTALGYGDVVLSDRWRLLGPLEAINGLLLFGLSTGLMFAILSRLITNRLRGQFGPGDGGAESR